MSFSASNLTQRKGVWYFKKRVPKELQSAYGRTMISLSLDTKDEREARVIAQDHRDRLEREFAGLGRISARVADGYSGTLLHLTEQDEENFCLRYRSNKLLEDEQQRSRGIDATLQDQDVDMYGSYVPILRAAYGRGDLTEVYNSLETFLRSIKVRVPRGTPSYERLARRFQVAEIEVFEAILKRRQGHAVPIPLAPVDSLSFNAVFEAWKLRKANRPAKTVRSFEAAFELLNAFSTASTASMFRKSDAIAFRDHLIASGECSRPTVLKHLGFLRAAFQLQVDDERLEKNPFDRVEVEIDAVAKRVKSRVPFGADQLKLWFEGRVYKPGFSSRPSIGAAARWLPLLALYEGARLEELGQLQCSDVVEDPDHGWYLSIHTLDDDESEASSKQKHVKNASSIRHVPVHPRLIELGFIDYVNHVRSGPLFPSLRPDMYGILTTSYSTWFGREKVALGITNTKHVFHSFRHAFVQVCKVGATTIPSEVREAMIGHMSPKAIQALYGSEFYPLQPMVEAIRQVEFKGLDLTHLKSLGMGREYNAPYVEPVRRPRTKKA